MKFFKNSSIYFTFLFAGSVVLASCSNDSDDPKPQHTATITFTSPAEHATINGGDTAIIAGTITSNEQIHGYKIYVRNTTTGADTLLVDDHAHATQVPFSGVWINDVTAHSEIEAEVVVTLDHDGNTASKKLHFHAMP